MMFMYQFPVNFEFFRKETKYVAIGTIGAGIINIILNAMMIPIWGIYGAAFATMLSYAMLFVFHNFLVKQMKEYQYNIDLLPFIRGFIAVLFGVAFFYILSYVWYIRWCLGILIGLYELVKIYKRKTIFITNFLYIHIALRMLQFFLYRNYGASFGKTDTKKFRQL